MKAISVKAGSSVSIAAAVKRIEAYAASKCVTIAAISGAVCLAGALAGSDPAMYAGAFAALAAIRPAAKKGGAA